MGRIDQVGNQDHHKGGAAPDKALDAGDKDGTPLDAGNSGRTMLVTSSEGRNPLESSGKELY